MLSPFVAGAAGAEGPAGLVSDDPFTVDGTLIVAWASMKSFQRKEGGKEPPDDPGNPEREF